MRAIKKIQMRVRIRESNDPLKLAHERKQKILYILRAPRWALVQK